MYRIGVISDTHGLLRNDVTDVLCTCQAIVHAGDIGREDILKALNDMAPLYAVRGNVDTCRLPLYLSFELQGIRIFLIHNRRQIRPDISGRDLIIYGHSHKYECVHKAPGIWLNPGSCGVRRFALPLTFAVISVEKAGGPFQIRRMDLAVAPESVSGFPDCGGKDQTELVRRIMKDTDRGKTVAAMAARYRISEDLAARICRLYVTHPGVSADEILRKMGF